MDFKLAVANEIVSALNAAFGGAPMTAEEIAAALEVPPDTAMGDYAFPCFKLSKLVRQIINPEFKPSKKFGKALSGTVMKLLSDALVDGIHADFLSKVESVRAI